MTEDTRTVTTIRFDPMTPSDRDRRLREVLDDTLHDLLGGDVQGGILGVRVAREALAALPTTPPPSLDARLRDDLIGALEVETHRPPKPTQYRRGWADAHGRAASLVRMYFAREYARSDE